MANESPTHRNDAVEPASVKSINPFAVGGAFLDWCVKQGWLVKEGKRHYATEEGVRELEKHFNIKV